MPLVNLLENMDLENSQKEILKQVIVKSCLTTASLKLLTDEQLCAIGFPLPAIVEMKALLERGSPNAYKLEHSKYGSQFL